MPQDHRHGSQIGLQQRLQDVLNDGVLPKREESFELAHAAGFPRRQHDTYDAHSTA